MPNRIIKESIRTSKAINALTDFQFRVWTYLITYVDDYGRGSADPELLKGFVFPRKRTVTEEDIQQALTELEAMGCISCYAVEGEAYFCFPNWGIHQRIQTKRSKYPEPPQEKGQEKSTVDHRDPPSESNPNPNPNPNSYPNPNSEAFETFWKAYPRKSGKGAAEAAWKRCVVTKEWMERVLLAVEQQKRSEQWSRDKGKYIPNPATWLSQRRWEDEVEPPGRGGCSSLSPEALQVDREIPPYRRRGGK